MGRDFKLADGRLRNDLLRRIKRGERLTDACVMAGISYGTFCRYRRDGEPPANPDEDPLNQPRPVGRGPACTRARKEYDQLALLRRFWHEVEDAEAHYRNTLDNQLRKLAQPSFPHLLTYARLRFPERYRETAPQSVVQVNQAGHDGGALTFARIAADAMADAEEGNDD